MTLPELVFAVRQSPFPLTHGAGIRTHRLLTGLARSFAVTLVTYEHQSYGEGRLRGEELARELPGIRVISVPGLRAAKRRSQVLSLLSARSWQWGRYPKPVFDAAIRSAVARTGARIVHFDDLTVARSGPLPGTVSAFAPHNVEHRITRGAAQAETGARAAFAELEWRKIQREEQRVWRAMPLCFAVSEIDAETLRAGGARRVELCPNGVDPVERLPLPRRRPNEPLRVLFVGTASYQPYEHGLRWFVRDVLPRVRLRSAATFDVVGAPPLRPATTEGVTYRGRVPELSTWYKRAHVVVVPVFHGSGTRLKVLEAMAYGRPVVSTPLGAEGLPVRAGEHYLEAPDADSFVRHLLAVADGLAHGGDCLAAMLSDARGAVVPLFWPNVVAGLSDSYRAALERLLRSPALA